MTASVTLEHRGPTRPAFDLAALLALYDSTRFLDAYRATVEAWRSPALVARLSVPELIHGGRLAGRLGSDKVRRWLFREARSRAPGNPLVRYYARHAHLYEPPLAQSLRDFEREPELAGADAALTSSWLASHAQLYASFRDFDRAHELISRARANGGERAWVAFCEGEILLAEDRWDEALAVTEEAWQRAPGMPAVSSLLGRVSAKLCKLHDVAERLAAAAAQVQSFESVGTAVWYLCAAAEQSDGEQRAAFAERASALCTRLDELTPLADRAARSYLARVRTDAAMLTGDRSALAAVAREVREPFFRAVAERLEQNPDGERLLLPIRRVYQKHLACFPASVAAAAGAFGVTLDEDALSRALTYDGTSAWRILDWLREQGFVTAPFLVTPTLARALLRAGVPFVYLTEGLTSSHATVAMGLDEACGTVIIHDPSTVRWDQVLIDRLHEGEAPFGPEGIAFVPRDRAHLLDVIPPDQREPYAAYIAHRKALDRQGPAAARAVVEDLARRYPNAPFTQRLTAIQAVLSGDVHAAIELQQRLLDAYPESVPLRRELLHSLRQTGDAAEIRRRLADIVERGQLPGIRTRETWRYPPPTYLAQYADYLGVGAEQFDAAERLLWKAARHDPFSSEAYHVLGDVLARGERHTESLFAYRLAATLAAENDHYARAYADAVRLAGDEGAAVAWLSRRVEVHGRRVEGHHAWLTLVDALEDYGRPDEAMREMRAAEATHADDAAVASYATRFWVRMGDWSEAERALATVERAGHRTLWLEAAVNFLASKGAWPEALPLAEAWVRESPERIEARRSLLRLVGIATGRRAALARSAEWLRERPGHDDLEHVHYDALRDVFDDDEATALLAARVARNPQDAWAWRELGHAYVDRASVRTGADRDEALARGDEALAQAIRLAPDLPATLALAARLEHARGQHAEAVQLLLGAVDLDPSFSFAYARAFEWSEGLSREGQRRCLEALDKALLRVVGHLHDARRLAFDIARRFGAKEAEAAVGRWQRARPDDPELVEAAADLLLEYGQGVRDAERAVMLLEPAVRRFPSHQDLAFSLAQAYGVLLREDDEIAVFRELLRKRPLNGPARKALARVLAHRGDVDEAVRLLGDGTTHDPLDEELWHSAASFLWDFGRHAESVATLERALERLPESVSLRESLIDELHETGADARAVEVARAGTALFPRGAYVWYLFGRALDRSGLAAGLADVEAAYRRALAHNPELYDAASALSVVLARQRRFDEARELVLAQVPFLGEPSPAHARLAWLTREAGGGAEARREMRAVLRAAPQNRWGWSMWMDWVEEDEAWDEAKEGLVEVHATLLDSPRFATRRLALLESAGSAEGLDAEWDRVLADFPRDQEVHLRRFDALVQKERLDEARAVLARVERFHPFSGYLLARKVEVLARSGDVDAALEVACRVWQLPGDDEEWPESHAFESLTKAGHEARAAHALLDLVLAGHRVRRSALRLLVQKERLVRLPVARSGWRRRLPVSAGSVLLAILEALMKEPQGDAASQAVALGALATAHRRTALRWWRRHREPCNRSTPLWQAVGSTLARFGRWRRRDLVEWMRGWRERHGVEMWALANYAEALRTGPRLRRASRADLIELLATARDALERLAHDWVAQYLAKVGCEAALRLERDDEFLALADRYEGLLKDDSRTWWRPGVDGLEPPVVLLFRDLLRAPDREAVRAACSALVTAHAPQRVSWLARAWVQRLRGRLPLLARWNVRLRLWLGVGGRS